MHVALTLALLSPALGPKVATHVAETAAAHAGAELSGCALAGDGSVRLGRALVPVPLGLPGVDQVWDALPRPDGSTLLATGVRGKLVRLPAKGAVEVLHEATGGPLTCLCAEADGVVYAGGGPGGVLLRVDPAGVVTPVKLPEGVGYVWSLVPDPVGGGVVAGTGPRGRILRISGEAISTLLDLDREEHLLAVAVDAAGTVFAGGSRSGAVYRVGKGGRPFVVWEAPHAEVRRVLLAAGGGIFVATSDAGKDATNAVYRVAPDGSAREWFRTRGMLTALVSSGDRLLVGVAPAGRVVELSTRPGTEPPEVVSAERARLDAGGVFAVAPAPGGDTLVGTGSPGRLWRLSRDFARTGTLTSAVLDAKLPARWGTPEAAAETPPGTTVRVELRGGNARDPDATWTPWAATLAESCRFAQYRVALSADTPDATPVLRGVRLSHATLNVSPEISSLEVGEPDAKEPKRLPLKWAAADANGDELSFDVWARRDGWPEWVRFAPNLAKPEWSWDTTTVPEGTYCLRVTASDRPTRGPEALSASRESAARAIVHTPPAVTLTPASRAGTFAVEAKSAAGRVRALAYALDGGPWVPLPPADGLYDAPAERATLDLGGVLAPGAHLLTVRATDAAGNTGLADRVFTVGR